MMQKKDVHELAVSPVVGVMLMLVVTIIIAAVVSAFSGGMAQTTSKTPQINIGLEAHNDDSIYIDHTGGDTISGDTVIIKTYIPSGIFKDVSHQVNLNNVTYLPTGTKGISYTTIQPGDKVKIDWADAFATSSYGGYMAPSVGEPVNIEIYDSGSGKVIATAQTNILP